MTVFFANIHELRLGLTLLGVLGLTAFLYKTRVQNLSVKPPKLFRSASFVVWLVFLGLSGYQARWQLLGFFSPDFLRVQRGYDPRGEILGSRFHRGSLLDRHHQPLAMDTAEDGFLHRRYPLGEAAVHVVGYNHSKYGSSGLEKELEPILMGRSFQSPADGFRLAGNALFHRTLRGNPVILTIDGDLQRYADELLQNKAGAIVVLDPRDGSIRAMASRPGFDPSGINDVLWRQLQTSDGSPFLNRAMQGLYPPGSTFKILTAAVALEQGKNPVFVCGPDGFDSGPADPRVRDHAHYRDSGFGGHGNLNMTEALSVSCNVYFAYLADMLTAPVILDVARNMNLSEHVRFSGPSPATVRGRLPDRAKWHTARTARLGIGQDDVLLTPLHLAVMAGVIGNGGMMVSPKLVETQASGMMHRVLDLRTANQVARMMIKSVETGTGEAAKTDGIVVGGKTGTAQVTGRRSHALFVCFAPWPRPAVAIAIVIEHGGMGGVVAAPLAERLIRRADELGLLEDREMFHGRNR
jgi:penicillin-binding protein A